MTPADIRPATAWALVVGFALVLLAVPAWRQVASGHDGVLAAWNADDGAAASGLLSANRDLLGRLEAVETAFEDGSPLRAAALPTVQWALLRFGVGNETVYVAGPRPEWLTLRTGFDHTTGPAFLDPDVLERRRRAVPVHPDPPLQPDPRPALLDLHRQLQERKIELLVVPVPSKPAVVPSALGVRASPGGSPARNPSLGPLLDTLRDAGIEVLDPSALLGELGEDSYLRTDSHWSPAAVDGVAAALAERLERFELGPRDRDWVRTPLGRTGRGDLWRALAVPAAEPLLPEETVETQQVTSWDGLLWAPVRGAPVLLLGDSFSTVYSDDNLHWGTGGGLAEQLAYHLGRDVDRIARPDGASDQVRRELVRRPGRLDGVRVVVYQVATREFSVGDWPVLELSPEDRPIASAE
ncbi:MAG: hypothetical protein AAFY88_01525 [Acidobacteriota bacterium]